MKYTLSNHAFQRFWERVQKGASKKRAEEWIENAIKKGVDCGIHEGRQIYRFENYKIVIDPNNNTVITISYFSVFNNKELSNEIHKTIVAKVNRELRKAFKDKRKYIIEYHEANMRLWKVNNPMTKQIIRNDINDLKLVLARIDDDIEALKKTAKKYYIDQEKLYLMEQ